MTTTTDRAAQATAIREGCAEVVAALAALRAGVDGLVYTCNRCTRLDELRTLLVKREDGVLALVQTLMGNAELHAAGGATCPVCGGETRTETLEDDRDRLDLCGRRDVRERRCGCGWYEVLE